MKARAPENLLDPYFHANGDPHALWSWMRENAPVYRHENDEYTNVVSLTRYTDLQFVYSNPQIFSSRQGALLRKRCDQDDPGAGLTLALTDPPKHRDIRMVMAPFFSGLAVKSMENSVRKRFQRILNTAREKESVNFSEDISARLTFEITAEIIGIPEEDNDRLFQWLAHSFHKGASILKHSDCYVYMLELIHERAVRPRDDLVSKLILAKTEHGNRIFSDLEVLLNCENLLGATENAGLTLSSAISSLLNHPHQRSLLENDPDLIKSGLHEILRWTSSATHSMRTVILPTKMHGVTMKVGDRVALWIPSANRDPSIFATPDTFDLRNRSANAIALGAGEHVCIGGLLARLQLSIVLTELVNGSWNALRTGPETPLPSIAVNGPEIFPVKIF